LRLTVSSLDHVRLNIYVVSKRKANAMASSQHLFENFARSFPLQAVKSKVSVGHALVAHDLVDELARGLRAGIEIGIQSWLLFRTSNDLRADVIVIVFSIVYLTI
jgi:hypothetical protein